MNGQKNVVTHNSKKKITEKYHFKLINPKFQIKFAERCKCRTQERNRLWNGCRSKFFRNKQMSQFSERFYVMIFQKKKNCLRFWYFMIDFLSFLFLIILIILKFSDRCFSFWYFFSLCFETIFNDFIALPIWFNF